MNFNHDKLKQIADKFIANLPDKLRAICNAYLKLTSQWSADTYQDLLSRVHGLTGSAGTYGFEDLSDLSVRIENILKHVADEASLATHKQELDPLFAQLASYRPVGVEENAPRYTESALAEVDDGAICCLLNDDDKEKMQTILGDTGYIVKVNSTISFFKESLELSKPGIAIIDVTLLDELHQTELHELNEKYLQNVIVIAISRSSIFRFREIAARINAAKFVTWPISSDQLLDAIRHINAFNQLSHRILIVDDEEDVANYYANLLEQHGLTADVMTDVSKIDDVLHCSSPDLILMDLRMPHCDGQILAHVIRQQSVYENVPILFLSAEQEYSKQLHAMSSGADDFLCKKIPHDLLVLAIKNKLRSYDRLCRHINKDLLTGEFNKDEITRVLGMQMLEAKRMSKPVCVALLTINGYDSIISTYGSVAGDQVMRALSTQLRKDLHARDIIGRVDKDSFFVVFPDTTLTEAESMLEGVKKHYSSITFWLDHRATAAAFSFSVMEVAKQTSADEVLDACSAGMSYKGIKVT